MTSRLRTGRVRSEGKEGGAPVVRAKKPQMIRQKVHTTAAHEMNEGSGKGATDRAWSAISIE
jgi:hypothetical protein